MIWISKNGDYELVQHSEGNFWRLYKKIKPQSFWSSGFAAIVDITNEDDRDLAIYDLKLEPIWRQR